MERTISLQEGVHIVPPSGQLVGFTWADEERLLVTSTSQVVLCCARTGARLREYTFRPARGSGFTRPATRIGEPGRIWTVQGQNRVVAWNQQDSASPPILQVAEVPFPVGQVVAGPKCVWVLGAGGQVAVYQLSTLQPAAPALLGRSTVPEGATAALSSVVLDARTVLVRRGSLLEGFYLSDLGQLVAIDAADVDDVAPCDGAMVINRGIMPALAPQPSSGLQEVLVWSVWAHPNGGVWWSVGRASVKAKAEAGPGVAGAPPSCSVRVRKAFVRQLQAGQEEPASKTPSKRRKRSLGGSEAAVVAGGWSVVGLAPLPYALIESPEGVVQAWDLQHGVAITGQAPKRTTAIEGGNKAAGLALPGGAMRVVGPAGDSIAVVSGEASEAQVVVYLVTGAALSDDQPQAGLGLKGALGRLRQPSSVPAAEAARSGLKFSGATSGWQEDNDEGAEAGQQGSVLEVVRAALHDTGAPSGTTRKKRPRAGEAGGLSRRVCRAFVDEVLDRPSEDGWKLMEAALACGVLGNDLVRDGHRPRMLEELAEQGKWAMVRQMLQSRMDLPERAVVGVLAVAMRSDMKLKHLVSLISQAVSRPACAAFLRSALASHLDASTAVLLLSALGSIMRSRAVEGVDHAVEWVQALLDCHLVGLVLEGASSGEVLAVIEAVKNETAAQIKSSEALDDMVGHIEQLQKPQGMEVQAVPDYSIEDWDLS